MKQINYKKLILPNIPYVFIALLITKVSEAARLAPGADLSGKLLNIMTGMSTAFQSIMPSFHPIDLCVGIAAAVVIRLVVYFKGKNAKKFRKNLEYGSARWGNADDIRPYVDPVFENNIILTQTECLTMNNRPKDPKTARNKNVLIIGGSGSGKTRFWLKPNLLQCTSKTYPVSFVVTDPKGSIVTECGNALRRNQYRIKILNTINFKKSHHYNPFAYSKKFLAEHEADITLHKAAKKHFDELGIQKLPTVKSLQAEYAALMAEKKAAYAEYRKAREDMKELLTAKANIDRILELDEVREEPNGTKEKEAEQR